MITRGTYHGNQSDRAKPLKSMTQTRSLNENPPLQSSKKVLLSNFKNLSSNGKETKTKIRYRDFEITASMCCHESGNMKCYATLHGEGHGSSQWTPTRPDTRHQVLRYPSKKK